ncbi:28S ribosomal protein S22, mitochondrial isoform X1 [Solenopsis invicta]|uniref:28S ribosomal protein S22, mitochondrial isoform X1 n=1 Tax=Solenopsis invicta TaxID=13686 RepID=UPI00059599BC|nr:28S ribosomal protein S22, mitochondrial isoform X1 [Solenopsis invicta]
MFSRYISKLLPYSYSRAFSNCRGFASTNIETDSVERDPAPFFFNKEVQTCLKILTTVDYNKVFRNRKDGHKLQPPQYKFLTDEQLQEAMEATKRRAEKYLQMPPVVKPRIDRSVPLEEDVALEGHDNVRYVFTDITYGLKDRERFIVIREPNGTLRHATWKERDRMIQTFFPRPERKLQKPKMFEDEYLKDLLNCSEYEFILDRACVQFEPDDPEYQTITRKVYEHINAERCFDLLRSTRHFGPMVFHLVWTSNIDNLLCEMIETSRVKDATLLIRLYHMIHATAKSTIEPCKHTDDAEFIMHYANLENSPKRDKIQKLLQSYKELQREYEIVAENIKQAHGISSETNKV